MNLRGRLLMPLEGAHESLWIRTAESNPREPLNGDVQAEVALIGAGIVGITAAYLLAKEGVFCSCSKRIASCRA